MRKILTLLILTSILYSCKKNILATENEINSVQKVADFYDGICKSYKGFSSENTNVKTYFELELRESSLIEGNEEKLIPHSGNIAHIFYSNLKEEKNNYNQIIVKIITKDNKKTEYKYSIEELKEIEKYIPKIENISKLIKAKNFEEIQKTFEKKAKIDAIQIEELFKNIETKFGIFNHFQFQGFEVMEAENIGDVIKFNLIHITEKNNLNLSLIFKRDNQSLLSIEF